MFIMSKEKITENKVIVENGEIKTIFSEEVQNNGGWMDIEESFRLIKEGIKQVYENPNF